MHMIWATPCREKLRSDWGHGSVQHGVGTVMSLPDRTRGVADSPCMGQEGFGAFRFVELEGNWRKIKPVDWGMRKAFYSMKSRC